MCIFYEKFVYKIFQMRTNIVINDLLMKKALKLSGVENQKGGGRRSFKGLYPNAQPTGPDRIRGKAEMGR